MRLSRGEGWGEDGNRQVAVQDADHTQPSQLTRHTLRAVAVVDDDRMTEARPG